MANLSITEEIAEIRKMLSSLQSRLCMLESSVAPTPPKPTDDFQSTPAAASDKLKRKERSGSSAANRQTLRSRSFKVMQHLINVVDVSHLDHQTVHGPKRRCKALKTSGTPTSFQQSSRSQPVDGQEVAKASLSESVASGPPTLDIQAQNINRQSASSKCDAIRVFHPKRPRKDAKTLSQSNSSASHPQLPCEDVDNLDIKTISQTISSAPHPQQPHKDVNKSKKRIADKIAMPNVNPKTQKLAAIPSQQPTDTLVQDQVRKEIFRLNTPEKKSDRFEILKLDPAVSDLLPLSGNDYTCFTTNIATQIKNLPRASSSLVKQQTLGVWEWREGTSTAKLYEYYRFSNSEATIDKRRFKYVGWAWKGKMDQQPPRIQDLPEEIHQDCDTLRWYWFKDLWLLFYFD